MVTLQIMDTIFYEAQRQGRLSFYLTTAGEEAINIASAAALTLDDFVLPQVISYYYCSETNSTSQLSRFKISAIFLYVVQTESNEFRTFSSSFCSNSTRFLFLFWGFFNLQGSFGCYSCIKSCITCIMFRGTFFVAIYQIQHTIYGFWLAI